MAALQEVTTSPHKVQEFLPLDIDCEVQVRPKQKILTESEKTLHRLENEIDRLNINSSSPQEIKVFCISALQQLRDIFVVEKKDALIIEQTQKLIKIVQYIYSNADKI